VRNNPLLREVALPPSLRQYCDAHAVYTGRLLAVLSLACAVVIARTIRA
jgi:hypothetical protein